MRGTHRPGGLASLSAESRHYAMLMRKYQVETLRREIPLAGYVVSVIRDFPTATMGLLDYMDQPKWTPAEWAWQGDTMCLLQTENDRRSYIASETFPQRSCSATSAHRNYGTSNLPWSCVRTAINNQVLHQVRRKCRVRNSVQSPAPSRLNSTCPPRNAASTRGPRPAAIAVAEL